MSERPPRERWTPRQVALLDDLERLFTAEGFRHLTIGDMAARTKSSRRTLYSVSASKEEIILVVVDIFLFNDIELYGIESDYFQSSPTLFT